MHPKLKHGRRKKKSSSDLNRGSHGHIQQGDISGESLTATSYRGDAAKASDNAPKVMNLADVGPIESSLDSALSSKSYDKNEGADGNPVTSAATAPARHTLNSLRISRNERMGTSFEDGTHQAPKKREAVSSHNKVETIDVHKFFEDELASFSSVQQQGSSQLESRTGSTTDNEDQSKQDELGKQLKELNTKQANEANKMTMQNNIKYTMPDEKVDRLLTLSNKALHIIDVQSDAPRTGRRRSSFTFEETEVDESTEEAESSFTTKAQNASLKSARAKVALRILEYVFEKLHDYSGVLRLVSDALHHALYRDEAKAVDIREPKSITIPECYSVQESDEQRAKLHNSAVTQMIATAVTRLSDEDPEAELQSEVEFERRWSAKLHSLLEEREIANSGSPTISGTELTNASSLDMRTDNGTYCSNAPRLGYVKRKFAILNQRLSEENNRLIVMNDRIGHIVVKISNRWRRTILNQTFRTWRENATKYRMQLQKIHQILLRAALSRLKRVSFQEWSRYVKRKQWQRTEEEANKLMQSVANLTEERDKMSKDLVELENARKEALTRRQNLQQSISELSEELKTKKEQLNNNTEYHLRSSIRAWIRFADASFEAELRSCAVTLETLSGPLPDCAPVPGINEHCALAVSDSASSSMGFGDFGRTKNQDEDQQVSSSQDNSPTLDDDDQDEKRRRSKSGTQQDPTVYQETPEIKGFRLDMGTDQGYEKQYVVNPVLLLTAQEIAAAKAATKGDDNSEQFPAETVAQQSSLPDLPAFEQECLKTLASLPFDVLLLRWVNFHTHNGNVGLWRDWWRTWYREVTAPKASASVGVRDLRKKVKKHVRRSTKVPRRRSVLARRVSQASSGGASNPEQGRSRAQSWISSMSGKSRSVTQSGVDYEEASPGVFKALVEATVPPPADDTMLVGSSTSYGHVRFGEVVESAIERRSSYNVRSSKKPIESLEQTHGRISLDPAFTFPKQQSTDDASQLLDMHIWSYGVLNSIPRDSSTSDPLRRLIETAAGVVHEEKDNDTGQQVADSATNGGNAVEKDNEQKNLRDQIEEESDWRGSVMQIENFGNSFSGGDAYALLLHRISVSNSFSMTQLSTCRELLYPVESLSREGSYNPAAVEWHYCEEEKRSKSRRRRSSDKRGSKEKKETLKAVANDNSYFVSVDREGFTAQLQVPTVFPTCSRSSRAGSSSASQKTDAESLMHDTRKVQRSNACIVPFPTALPQFPSVLSQVDDTGRAREIIEYLSRIGCPKELLKKDHIMQSENYSMRNLTAIAFMMTRWPELRSPDGWCIFPRDSSEDPKSRSEERANSPTDQPANNNNNVQTHLFSGRSAEPLLPFHVVADQDWDFQEEKTRLLNRLDNLMAVGDDTMLAHPCTLKRVMEILTRLRLEWRSYVTAVMIVSSPADRADEVLSINPENETIPELSKLSQDEASQFDFLNKAHDLAESWRSASRMDTIDNCYDPQIQKKIVDSRPVTLASVALKRVRDVVDQAVTVRRMRASMWTRLRDHIQSASWSLIRSLTQSASHACQSGPQSGSEEAAKTAFTDEQDGLTIIDRGAVRVYHAYAIAPLSMLNPIAPVYLFVSDTEWLPADMTASTIQQATRLTLDYTQQGQVVSRVMSRDPELVMRTMKEQSIFDSSGFPDDSQHLRDFAKGASRAIISLINTISDRLQNWHKLTQQIFLHYAATAEGDTDTMDWKEFLGFVKECRIMRRDEEEEKIRESLRKKKQKGPVGPIRQGGGAGMGKFSVLVSTGGKSTLVQRPSSADDYNKVPKSGLTRRELRSCFIASVADEKKRDKLLFLESDSDPFWEPDAELGQSEFVSLLVRTAVNYFRRERIVERARSRIEEERRKRDKARESSEQASAPANVQAGGLAIAAKLREGKMSPEDFLKLKRERPDLFNAVRRGDYGIDLKLTADGMMQQWSQKNKQQSKAAKEGKTQPTENEPSKEATETTEDSSSRPTSREDFKSSLKAVQNEPSAGDQDTHVEPASSGDMKGQSLEAPQQSTGQNESQEDKGTSEELPRLNDNEGGNLEAPQQHVDQNESVEEHDKSEETVRSDDNKGTSQEAPPESMDNNNQHSEEKERYGSESRQSDNSISRFSTKRDGDREVSFSFTPDSAAKDSSEAVTEDTEENDNGEEKSLHEYTELEDTGLAEQQEQENLNNQLSDAQNEPKRVTFEEPNEAQKARPTTAGSDAPDPFQTTDAYEHDVNGDKVQFGKFHYYTEDSVTNHVLENLRQVTAEDEPKRSLMSLTIHPSVAYEAFMKWFVLPYGCRSQQSAWHQELKRPSMRAIYRKHHNRLTNMFSAFIQKRAYRLKKTLKKDRPNEISAEEVDSVVAAGAGAMTLNDVCDFLRMNDLLLTKKKKKQAEKAHDRTHITGAISGSSMKHCMLFDIRGAVRACGTLKGLELLTTIMKVVDSNRLISVGEYVYNVEVELLYDARKIFRLKKFRKLLQREGITNVDGIRLFQFVPTLMRVDKDLAHAVLSPSELPLWRLARSHRDSYYQLVKEEDSQDKRKQKGKAETQPENQVSDQDEWDEVLQFEDSDDEDEQSDTEDVKKEKTKEKPKQTQKQKKEESESEKIPPPPSIGMDEELQYGELMELLPALAGIYDPRPHVSIEKKFNSFVTKYVPEELRAKKGKLRRQPSNKTNNVRAAEVPETIPEQEGTADVSTPDDTIRDEVSLEQEVSDVPE